MLLYKYQGYIFRHMKMNTLTFFAISTFFVCISCQKEEREVVGSETDSNTPLELELVEVIKKVVLHDGSFDDIVDTSNCFSINIPYSIFVNNEKIAITSADQYAQLTESDEIEIQYPITITSSDHSQTTLNDQRELEDLKITCSMIDDDIECIDFVYPFEISTFSSTTNQFSTLEIIHDTMLFGVISDNTTETSISINYPINLRLHNGQFHSAAHNTDLHNAILNQSSVCDEND